ncbi:MAG: AAA family ATPase [Planctomycetota bacterium]
MHSLESLQSELDGLRSAVRGLLAHLDARVVGHPEITRQILECLAASGHCLLEGAPGLGKTTLVRTLAQRVDLDFNRVQFTPDLMPGDIIGSRILKFDERGAQGLQYEPGPVHTQILLADEINRATPRTQSALLEAMEERQVTVFGETRKLPEPFMVVATQNPIEMEGTFPLPEAQLDRFLIKLDLPLPTPEQLQQLLLHPAHTGASNEDAPRALHRAEVLRLQSLVKQIAVGEDVAQWVARIVHASHPTSPLAGAKVRALVRHGSSPRGGLALLSMARARALLAGSLHVRREDIQNLAPACLQHRILLNFEGQADANSLPQILDELLRTTA